VLGQLIRKKAREFESNMVVLIARKGFRLELKLSVIHCYFPSIAPSIPLRLTLLYNN